MRTRSGRHYVPTTVALSAAADRAAALLDKEKEKESKTTTPTTSTTPTSRASGGGTGRIAKADNGAAKEKSPVKETAAAKSGSVPSSPSVAAGKDKDIKEEAIPTAGASKGPDSPKKRGGLRSEQASTFASSVKKCPRPEKKGEAATVNCSNAGCDQRILSAKAMDHIQECYYREVECHENPNIRCLGEKIPLLEIPKHYEEKHGIPTSYNSRLVLDLNHGEIDCDTAWGCGIMHFDEKYFVTHAVVVDQKFHAWVTILGCPQQAEQYKSTLFFGEKDPTQRKEFQDFMFELPVYPHLDFPRFPCLEGSQALDLETFQELSVLRNTIPDENDSSKYSFKLRIKVTKVSPFDNDG